MSPHAHAPELPYCRNCHFTLAVPRPVYCGHCGQETDLHPPSVREMLTEYLGHYVALDGPLWRTLWALICLPGLLTNAYFHGTRRRYVLPLRVYLSASFVFFVGWALLPQGPTQFIEAGPATQAETVAAARGEPPASAASAPRLNKQIGDCDMTQPQTCSPVERWLDGVIDKAAQMTFDQWKARARALAPYAMLAMQPVFAALLLLTFAGSGRRYAEHFVFSLHTHSLWFLAMLLAVGASLEGSLLMAVFAHGLVALRRVYGLGWWGALWRGLVLSCLYFILLSIVATVFALLIAATA